MAGVVTGTLSPTSIYSGGPETAIYDIDNNGVSDFQVLLIDIGSNEYELNIAGMNGTLFETNNGFYDLVGYNLGIIIGVNGYENSGVINPPYFPYLQKKYFGMKFIINGNTHCAYVGVQYDGSGGYQLLDFGYDETPDVCVIAGSNVSVASVESLEIEAYSFYPNPVINELHVELSGLNLDGYIITIKDLTGKVVFDQFYDKDNTTIDFSAIDGGLYLLEIHQNNQVIHSEKILKSN
ncbi:MAG: hypothetical protein ACJASQ_002711 [Crocinitomicaceae bacterium]|jgi:hypothetical protein